MNPQLLFQAIWQGVVSPRTFYNEQYTSIPAQHFRALYGFLLMVFAVAATTLNMSLRNGVSRTLGLIVCQLATCAIFYGIGRVSHRRAAMSSIFDWTCFAGCAIIPATILTDVVRIGGFDSLSGVLLLGFSVYMFVTGAIFRFQISPVLAWLGVLLPLGVSIVLIAVSAFLASGGLDIPLTGLGGLDGVEITTGSPRDQGNIEISSQDRMLESEPEDAPGAAAEDPAAPNP